jgi:hypothetical protein
MRSGSSQKARHGRGSHEHEGRDDRGRGLDHGRAHLVLLAAMLVVAVATGVVVGRVTDRVASRTGTAHVILPLDRLATPAS